jgi:hypothetical protein
MVATLQKQQELLRQASEPRLQRQVQVGCLAVLVVVAVAVVVWALSAREWGGLFAAALLVFMGIGIRHSSQLAAPHITRAAQALTQFDAVEGMVRVVAISDDGTTTYQAGVRDRLGCDWTFSFSPFDWCPETGDYPAQLRYASDVPWPVLVMTKSGLLCPFQMPKRQSLELPQDDVVPTRQSVRAGWIASVVFLAVGCLAVLGTWGVYLKDTGIAKSGGVAQAVVTRVGHLRAKPGENHGLVYQFTLPDGRVIERTVTDDAERWQAYRVGDKLTVHYELTNPQRNFPQEEGNQSVGLAVFLSVIGLMFTAVGALLGWGAWRAGRCL